MTTVELRGGLSLVVNGDPVALWKAGDFFTVAVEGENVVIRQGKEVWASCKLADLLSAPGPRREP